MPGVVTARLFLRFRDKRLLDCSGEKKTNVSLREVMMQPKSLPRYVGVVLLLLTLGYFLGADHVLPVFSHTLMPSARLQLVASPIAGPTTNNARMRGGSGTAIPDTISDLILTGVCVLITALLSVNFLLSQRRRNARQEHLQTPETDPIIAQVSIPKNEMLPDVPSNEEMPAQNSSFQHSSSHVTRLKNRLRAMG